MSRLESPILVPIRLQALVIEDEVINGAKPRDDDGFTLPGDGNWNPMAANFRRRVSGLESEGPRPFFGAKPSTPDEHGRLIVDRRDRPDPSHRGVHVRWIVPSGLRRGHRDAAGHIRYHALPDQWLLLRLERHPRGGACGARAWFIDGGLVGEGQPNMMIAKDGSHQAVRVGKAVPLKDYGAGGLPGERIRIETLGNEQTGAPTFTAFTANNRNCLSFHDDLADLRDDRGHVPQDLSLGYLVLGWYHDAEHEPLGLTLERLPRIEPFTVDASHAKELDQGVLSEALRERLNQESGIALSLRDLRPSVERAGESWRLRDPDAGLELTLHEQGDQIRVAADEAAMVLAALGWSLVDPPSELGKLGCLFHGLCANIHYWDGAIYRGPLLGYPGAPSKGGTKRGTRGTLKVGVGTTPQDALVALVARDTEPEGEDAALWKALEAVAYDQQDSLLRGWNPIERNREVHRAGFQTHDGGVRWSIHASDRDQVGMPSGVEGAEKPEQPRPDRRQSALLDELNRAQQQADRIARRIAAWQHDFYESWWRICQRDQREDLDGAEAADEECKRLATTIEGLRRGLEVPAAVVQDKKKELEASLAPHGLVLREEPGPRFFSPVDPVILVQSDGTEKAHHFPEILPCRRHGQTIRRASLTHGEEVEPFPEVADVVSMLEPRFSHHAVLASLIEEARVLEGAVATLASRGLPKGRMTKETEWQQWLARIDAVLSGKEDEGLELLDGAGHRVPPDTLVSPWRGQPWSPLFLDWRVTWYPDEEAITDEAWDLKSTDFKPRTAASGEGIVLDGRSMMAPLGRRVIDRVVKELRQLVAPQGKAQLTPVQERLSSYRGRWELVLDEVVERGLLGQALGGLHYALRGLDPTRPTIMPEPSTPWVVDDYEFQDASAVSPLRPAFIREGQRVSSGGPLLPPGARRKDRRIIRGRSGCLVLDELWIVDDFGQWVDLRHGSSAGGSEGLTLSPHLRWPGDRRGRRMTMAPRFQEPARLDFRLTTPSKELCSVGGTDSPFVGWVYFNAMDDALIVCDRNGSLIGELRRLEEGRARWENLDPKASPGVRNILTESQRRFVRGLHQPYALDHMLALVDHALSGIRPAGARSDDRLVGRPLALVRATLAVELFDDRVAATLGDGGLVVRLGCHDDPNDGLIGFLPPDMRRIVPTWGGRPEALGSSSYVADPVADALRLPGRDSVEVVLLVEPHGHTAATTGVLPTKLIGLPTGHCEDALASLEACMGVGPILLAPGPEAMPVPFGERGTWSWQAAGTEARKPVAEPSVRPDLPPVRPIVTHGRLIHTHDRE